MAVDVLPKLKAVLDEDGTVQFFLDDTPFPSLTSYTSTKISDSPDHLVTFSMVTRLVQKE